MNKIVICFSILSAFAEKPPDKSGWISCQRQSPARPAGGRLWRKCEKDNPLCCVADMLRRIPLKSMKILRLLICGASFFLFASFLYAQHSTQRVISLGVELTEELYLLGVQDKLVGTTIYCKRPPEAERKEKVGTVVEANIEKIISLNPDLVLATSLSNLKQMEKLKKLGIQVETFSTPGNFMQICQEFIRLAELVGEKKKAEAIVNQARNKVENIKRKTTNLPKIKVFIQVGANPLFTINKDSFINDFIDLAGGVNIAAGVASGLYSREKVVEQNPEVIIIVNMGLMSEEEEKIWQKYKTLNAVKDNRIYIMDAYKLCSPTPVSFAQTLPELVKIIHPESK